MNVKCILTLHRWDGCKCSRCGATRNKEHDGDGSSCGRCGRALPEEETRFLKAIAAGNYAYVEIRLKASPKLAVCKDIHGNTPLHVAVEAGHESVAQLLLDHSAKVNAKNQHGDTPLHLGAEKDHAPVAQLLLNRASVSAAINVYAAIHAKNRQRDTPLDVAARNDSVGVARLLFVAAEAPVMSSDVTQPFTKEGLVLLNATLKVARMSGSHRMAACLHRAKARMHREQAMRRSKDANDFRRFHEERAASGGGRNFEVWAMSASRDSQELYGEAEEEDRAADIEAALIENGNDKGKAKGGRTYEP